jgi:hypothetical protein
LCNAPELRHFISGVAQVCNLFSLQCFRSAQRAQVDLYLWGTCCIENLGNVFSCPFPHASSTKIRKGGRFLSGAHGISAIGLLSGWPNLLVSGFQRAILPPASEAAADFGVRHLGTVPVFVRRKWDCPLLRSWRCAVAGAFTVPFAFPPERTPARWRCVCASAFCSPSAPDDAVCTPVYIISRRASRRVLVPVCHFSRTACAWLP